jgi:phage N-6-adenine-methyltransferase
VIGATVETTALTFTNTFDDLQAINALDELIAAADTDIDRLMLEQATRVVRLLASGWSQRDLAAQWINARLGEPYSQMHVSFTARAFEKCTFQPGLLFRDIYNSLANPSRYGNSGDDEWFTRQDIVDAARIVLGVIDLDPASCEVANTVVKAERFFTIDDDGLTLPWHGRVWLNPPYSHTKISPFVEKLISHVQDGSITAAIALTSSETATRWFARLYRHADNVSFPSGRLKFWKADRNIKTPAVFGSALFYFGPDPETFQTVFDQFVWPNNSGDQ